LRDRLTHRAHIFEMNGESYRFRESIKARKEKDPKKAKPRFSPPAVVLESTPRMALDSEPISMLHFGAKAGILR
jgi:hypothetical protein